MRTCVWCFVVGFFLVFLFSKNEIQTGVSFIVWGGGGEGLIFVSLVNEL